MLQQYKLDLDDFIGENILELREAYYDMDCDINHKDFMIMMHQNQVKYEPIYPNICWEVSLDEEGNQC